MITQHSKALYGLIGFPLTHSFSPAYFNDKFEKQRIDAVYKAFPIAEIGALTELLTAEPELRGLNVTIPYKQAVIPFLTRLSDEARAIGAVNCIRISGDILEGFNTDVAGFRQSLEPLLRPQQSRALILGTGGASLAVAYVLRQLNIPFGIVSRSAGADFTYEGLTAAIIKEHRLIVNTTPLGMYPQTDTFPPIPYEAIGPEHLCYDLVYRPKETVFLQRSAAQGAAVKNGWEMLLLQAEASWEIWNGR